MVRWLRELLADPRLRGLDLDDPRTTEVRRSVLADNGFLRRVYACWYGMLLDGISSHDTRVLELGSGGGFLRSAHPFVITSDLLVCRHVDLVLDARALPFRTAELSAIVMTNVLHHIPDVRTFFTDAARCVRPGGALAMVEPWATPWARFVYNRLHHEPFDTRASSWTFPDAGPLSGANGALAWIVFERDRETFEREFPSWQIQTIRPLMPLRYLVSGGVSMRQLMPTWSYTFWSWVDHVLERSKTPQAMFAYIRLRRR